MKNLAAALALFASVLLGDVHWAVMQTLTWTEMARQETDAGIRSVMKIFSGESVCEHCEAIREGRDSNRENPSELLSQSRLLAAPLVAEPPAIPERFGEDVSWTGEPRTRAALFRSSVPVPPPRV